VVKSHQVGNGCRAAAQSDKEQKRHFVCTAAKKNDTTAVAFPILKI
jgi:hypothetical protein